MKTRVDGAGNVVDVAESAAADNSPTLAGADAVARDRDYDSRVTIGVSLPFVEDLDGGMIHSVEVPMFYGEQRAGLCRLRRALAESGAKLANGRVVESHADAVRYVLEQYEAGFDALAGT